MEPTMFKGMMQSEIIEAVATGLPLLDKNHLVKLYGIIEAELLQREFNES